jgi:hypothetical protein
MYNCPLLVGSIASFEFMSVGVWLRVLSVILYCGTFKQGKQYFLSFKLQNRAELLSNLRFQIQIHFVL